MIHATSRSKSPAFRIQGLFLETLFLTPVAIGFLIWLKFNGETPFFGGGIINISLAIGFGMIIVLPLLLFLQT